MFKFPYGLNQQLNLNWFIRKFKELVDEWNSKEESIDGALQAEIDRAESALSDVYSARDTAVAAKDDAISAKNDAINAKNDAQTAKTGADTAKSNADTAALKSEGYAVGEQNGSPVGSSSPYYNNNAKYNNQQAGINKFMAEAWAVGTMNGTPVSSGTIQYENNAKYHAQQAGQDAADAHQDKLDADADALATSQDRAAVSQDKDDVDYMKDQANAAALRSEGYAVGKQNGTAVDSSSPYYHNNAEYFKDQAEAAASSADGTAAQAMIAGAEASSTASAPHTAGTFFRLSGVLYEATDDIAIGDTITVGTNCKVAVVGDVLSEQSDRIDEVDADKADWYSYTLNGSVVTFDDAIANSPITKIVLNSTYTQSGTGTPSMSNVRPISVPSELTIKHSGSNTSNPTEYDIDASTLLATGTLEYNGDGTWTLKPKYVLVTVPYAFFSSATEISSAGSTNYWYFRNAFYNSGNGVTYRNRNRKSGGYFCISNCFSIYRNLNNTQNSSSQYRLTVYAQGTWTTRSAVLDDIKAYYDNGGTVQFLYEPTDTLPTYTFNTDEIKALTGENNIWSEQGSISVTYRIDVPKKFDEIDARFDIAELPKSDILTANDDAVNKILSSRWLRSETAKPLSLLWFSDIHRWQEPLNRILKFKTYLNSIGVIEDTIVTGDLVKNASSEGNTFKAFWQGTAGTEDILVALGNHDHYAQSSTPHGRATLSDLDSLFFDRIDNWGVERESNYPFYYKDYAQQGIRLIVADPFVVTSEADQTTWIEGVLADAKTNDLAVVVACHYLKLNSSAETQSVTIYDNNWSNNLARETGTTTMDYESTDFDLVACVSDFIEAGGNFLCYMIGHTHTDIVSHPTGHPEQLIINCACASDDRDHETKLTTNDLPRYDNTRTKDCFNVITFDAENKLIKCVRVGANVNMYQQPRTAFAYDVTNHTFISLI